MSPYHRFTEDFNQTKQPPSWPFGGIVEILHGARKGDFLKSTPSHAESY
jgi:hypothetical protein